MEKVTINALGLRCPQPVMKLAMEAVNLQEGTIVEILGDCETFEEDIRAWASRRDKAVLAVRPEGNGKCIQLRL